MKDIDSTEVKPGDLMLQVSGKGLIYTGPPEDQWRRFRISGNCLDDPQKAIDFGAAQTLIEARIMVDSIKHVALKQAFEKTYDGSST